MEQVDRLIAELDAVTPKVRQAVLSHLRTQHPIHEIEADWGVPAEVILEAISRSSDLSQRGVRGLIAEAYFEISVIPQLRDWTNDTPEGNHAFDYCLHRDEHTARIQVKTQRKKTGIPMRADEGYSHLPTDRFVVETQKTRAGKDKDGGDTRPYRFDDFDILAVNMEPSTGDWEQFRYTLTRWLLPRKEDLGLILKFQPVALEPDEDWTNDIGVALEWYVGEVNKRIGQS